MTKDLSISITLYSGWREGCSVPFHLRNLSGDAQAKQVMREVAEELYHLTGYGVDKGVIKAGGKKVEQVVYHGLEPQFGSASDIFKPH